MFLAQGSDDPALGDLVLAFEAFGVDAEQDLDAVADPLSDLGWRHSPVEPSGQARVAEAALQYLSKGRINLEAR